MEQFDVYCERTDFSFWSEPLNALTNLAFLAVAAIAFLRRPRDAGTDWQLLILIGLVAAVGVGSFLFHTLATRWASTADVLPITIFIYFFFFVAMRRLVGVPVVVAIVITAAFFLAARHATPWLRDVAGYSAGYLPPFFGMIVTGIVLVVLNRPGAEYLLLAAPLFAVSLVFRAADHAVCGSFPPGTHFLWHLFNAIVLFVLLRAVTEARQNNNKQESSKL